MNKPEILELCADIYREMERNNEEAAYAIIVSLVASVLKKQAVETPKPEQPWAGACDAIAEGEITRAGTFPLHGEEVTGLFISMSRDDLKGIKRLPMYRPVQVIEALS